MKAILVTTAVCHGSGSDRFKWISGLGKGVLARCAEIDSEAAILVYSNTRYQGQTMKLAKAIKGGFAHRQINDSDYRIIATI